MMTIDLKVKFIQYIKNTRGNCDNTVLKTLHTTQYLSK